jgi:hypothetical protein
MRLEIPIAEVQQFLRSQYKIDVDLKNIEENKIELTYINSVVLIIKEVKKNVVLFHYKVDGLAKIVTKIAHFFMEKKLDKKHIEWDKFTALNTFLEVVSISEILFIKDTIVLEMYARGKAKNYIN